MLQQLLNGELEYFPDKLNREIMDLTIPPIKVYTLRKDPKSVVSNAICTHFNITPKTLGAKTRARKSSYPRSIYWHILMKEFNLHPSQINRIGDNYFGRSNIINVARSIGDIKVRNLRLKSDLLVIHNLINKYG